MMTGFGQFGPVEMGGMFTVMKVRDGLGRNDYADPGWFKHPAGTVAYEVDNPATAPVRKTEQPQSAKKGIEVNVVKPKNNQKHQH
jgi:hypothetical protein